MSSNFIKNVGLKVCQNCKFFKPRDSLEYKYTLSECTKFGEKNIITGDITYIYASTCREDEKKCGKLAKHFEDQPDPREIYTP